MRDDLKDMFAIFESRGFIVRYFDTSARARDFICDELKDLDVGIGGSVTVEQMGLFEALKNNGNAYWHFFGDSSAIEKSSMAQAYISGVNAISKTGEIVNIDGRGNRVSSCMFGVNRKKLVYLCGVNKVCDDLSQAVWRAKNIAAPKNAQRLHRKTPCALKADKCYDCRSPERICNAMVIQTHPTSAQTYIVIVGEDLGY